MARLMCQMLDAQKMALPHYCNKLVLTVRDRHKALPQSQSAYRLEVNKLSHAMVSFDVQFILQGFGVAVES